MQKVLSFQEVGQKRKIVIKIEFTNLSLSDCKFVPLKRVLKKYYTTVQSTKYASGGTVNSGTFNIRGQGLFLVSQ